ARHCPRHSGTFRRHQYAGGRPGHQGWRFDQRARPARRRHTALAGARMTPATDGPEQDVDDLQFILFKTAELMPPGDPGAADVRSNLTRLVAAQRGLRDALASNVLHINPMLLGMEDTYQQQIASVRVFVEVDLAPGHHQQLSELEPGASTYAQLRAI